MREIFSDGNDYEYSGQFVVIVRRFDIGGLDNVK